MFKYASDFMRSILTDAMCLHCATVSERVEIDKPSICKPQNMCHSAIAVQPILVYHSSNEYQTTTAGDKWFPDSLLVLKFPQKTILHALLGGNNCMLLAVALWIYWINKKWNVIYVKVNLQPVVVPYCDCQPSESWRDIWWLEKDQYSASYPD